MQINLTFGDEIKIDGVKYKYQVGFDMGCRRCELYDNLNSIDECNIACGTGYLVQLMAHADIKCPYCGHNNYEHVNGTTYVCTNCEKEFIIKV